MSHIAALKLKNFRSFREAQCRLSPFTLVIGANNAGKTNFLKSFQELVLHSDGRSDEEAWWSHCHHRCRTERPSVSALWSDGSKTSTNLLGNLEAEVGFQKMLSMLTALDSPPPDARTSSNADRAPSRIYPSAPKFSAPLEVYRLNPQIVGAAEGGASAPYIAPDGTGVSWMLDRWNSGARAQRARFERVISALRRCVSEIEAVSFYDVDLGKRAIQVEQAGLPEPRPLSEVSDGTRLVLALLTLVNQENPPPVLLLEDIDRGLHPRLYEQLVAFFRALAAEGNTQIIATSHDPYLIDEFRSEPESVVLVEKENGESTLSNLDDRLADLRKVGADIDMPLGQIWFSGMVGGIPGLKLPKILQEAKP